MNRMRIERGCAIAGVVAAAALSGCSIFPYDSHYLCEATDDYGHCTSVQGAYKDAVNGSTSNADVADAANGTTHGTATQQPPTKGGHPHRAPAAVAPAAAEAGGRQEYEDAQYRTEAALIDGPVAPVLAPPKVLRTLMLAYQDNGVMYMPRYIFVIVDPAKFLMGNGGPSVPDAPMLYPNGGDPALAPGAPPVTQQNSNPAAP